jgi:hypothetical protein
MKLIVVSVREHLGRNTGEFLRGHRLVCVPGYQARNLYTQLSTRSMVVEGSSWLSLVIRGRQLVTRGGLRSLKPGIRPYS